jgi:hypothetical protein
MQIIVTKKCSVFLKSFALVAVLLLALGFESHANASTWYLFNVTFQGSGTLTNNSSDEQDTVKLGWTATQEIGFSDDMVNDPEHWGDSITSSSQVDVSGSYTWISGSTSCTGTTFSNVFPSDSHVMTSLSPGSLFTVGSMTYSPELYVTCNDGSDSSPTFDGFFPDLVDKHLSAVFTLPPDALAQGKIIQYVSVNETTPDCCGGTTTVEWNGTVTFEKLGEFTTPGNPGAPTSHTFSYQPTVYPVNDINLSQAQPVGIGPAADGGDTLDLHVGFVRYPAPLDLYLAVYFPSIDPNIWMIKPGPTIQPLSQGLAKWKENVTGPIDETIFSGIPVDILPGGQYYFYLMATPSGSTDLYYLWETSFAK